MDKFGFELEFAIPQSLSSRILYDEFQNDNWEVESDGSVGSDYHYGYEFKTPIFSDFSEISKELVRRLDFIKEYGSITTCSGLHFHFSEGKIHRKRLREYMMPHIDMWPDRIGYSEAYYNISEVKFQAVRKVDYGHYEFRAFNSTSSLDEIVSNFELLKKGIKECQLPLESD